MSLLAAVLWLLGTVLYHLVDRVVDKADLSWLAPQPSGPPQPRSVPRLEIGLRMLAGASLVLALTTAARELGTTWSGLLTIFPIATSVLAASSQRSGGPDQTLHLLRGLGSGLYSLTAFFATLAFGPERWSVAGAFLAASAAALVAQLTLFVLLASVAHATAKPARGFE